MNLLISGEKICKKIIYNTKITQQKNVSEKSKESSLIDGKVNSRKAKRRTKALKAKIAKFKTAELTERLNNSSKKTTEFRELETSPSKDDSESQSLYDQLVEFSLSNESIPLLDEDECDIVNSIKKNLVIGLESESEVLCERAEHRFSFACRDWKTKILSMPFNAKPKVQINTVQSFEQDFYLKPDDLSIFDVENSNTPELGGESLDALLYPSIKYLNMLLNKIISRYQKYWIIDYQLEKEVEENNGGTLFQLYNSFTCFVLFVFVYLTLNFVSAYGTVNVAFYTQFFYFLHNIIRIVA